MATAVNISMVTPANILPNIFYTTPVAIAIPLAALIFATTMYMKAPVITSVKAPTSIPAQYHYLFYGG